MSGTIDRLPSGSLRLRVYLGVDANGRTIRRTKTIAACSNRAARRALDDFVAEVRRHDALDHSTERATLAELLDAWLTTKKNQVSPGTLVDYERIARAISATELGAMNVRRIRPSHLDRYYDTLTVGPDRARRHHNVISGALGQAVRWEWIDRNPADNASPPKLARPKSNAPTLEQLRAIIAAAPDDLAVWLRVAAATGLRPGELAALRWSAVDLDTGQLSVQRAIGPGRSGTDGPRTGLVEKPTKTDRARTLRLDPASVDVLRAERARAAERALSAGVGLARDAYVFSHEPDSSKPWRPDSVGARFRRVRDELGPEFANVKFYGTRHFMATQALANGVDIQTVAHRLGHARTSTTLDRYAHAVEAADQRAADLLGNILSS